MRYCSRFYSLGQQVEEKVLYVYHVFWKFSLLAWAAWQLQFSPAACGTLRKHVTKLFPQPAAPDCSRYSRVLRLVLCCDGILYKVFQWRRQQSTILDIGWPIASLSGKAELCSGATSCGSANLCSIDTSDE